MTLASILVFPFDVASARAQEINGAPPGLVKVLGAFQKAFNSGDAAVYEAMAQAMFTADQLKKETAEARKKAYLKWFADMGSIKLGKMERHGVKAPLQIAVTGATANGVMWMQLDEASRIGAIRIEGPRK